MKLRNEETGQIVEGNFYKAAGFWQQDTPRMVSYHESQWKPYVEGQDEQQN